MEDNKTEEIKEEKVKEYIKEIYKRSWEDKGTSHKRFDYLMIDIKTVVAKIKVYDLLAKISMVPSIILMISGVVGLILFKNRLRLSEVLLLKIITVHSMIKTTM